MSYWRAFFPELDFLIFVMLEVTRDVAFVIPLNLLRDRRDFVLFQILELV